MVDVNLKVPALEKLADYAASGIGAVAGPMLATWKARQDAKARLIGVEAEADSLRMIASAQADARRALVAPDETGGGTLDIGPDGISQRIEFQERKRQANIAFVVRDAAAELGDKEVPDHEPDPDWTARFFNDVQDISSKELHQIWSKILAGEVESPGKTSLRSLSILKNLSQKIAEDFSSFVRYGVDNFIHGESYSALASSLPESVAIEFEELGLVHGQLDVYVTVILENNGTKIMRNCNSLLSLEGEAGKRFDLHGHSLTRPGRELAQFCNSEPDMEYLQGFAKFLSGHNCALKITPIIGRNANGFPLYKPNDFRVIEPAP